MPKKAAPRARVQHIHTADGYPASLVTTHYDDKVLYIVEIPALPDSCIAVATGEELLAYRRQLVSQPLLEFALSLQDYGPHAHRFATADGGVVVADQWTYPEQTLLGERRGQIVYYFALHAPKTGELLLSQDDTACQTARRRDALVARARALSTDAFLTWLLRQPANWTDADAVDVEVEAIQGTTADGYAVTRLEPKGTYQGEDRGVERGSVWFLDAAQHPVWSARQRWLVAHDVRLGDRAAWVTDQPLGTLQAWVAAAIAQDKEEARAIREEQEAGEAVEVGSRTFLQDLGYPRSFDIEEDDA